MFSLTRNVPAIVRCVLPPFIDSLICQKFVIGRRMEISSVRTILTQRRPFFVSQHTCAMLPSIIQSNVFQRLPISTTVVVFLSTIFVTASLFTLLFVSPIDSLQESSLPASLSPSQPGLSISSYFAAHPFMYIGSNTHRASNNLKSTNSNDVELEHVHVNTLLSNSQRAKHVLRRLSYYEGDGKGFARFTNIVVSVVGIFGMFAAVVGALLAPWLVEAGNLSSEDDRFVYWVRSDSDEDDDEDRVHGPSREEKYNLLRLLDTV